MKIARVGRLATIKNNIKLKKGGMGFWLLTTNFELLLIGLKFHKRDSNFHKIRNFEAAPFKNVTKMFQRQRKLLTLNI